MEDTMYELVTLETCRFGLDGGAMFGVVPKSLWERAYTQPDVRNRIPMAARILLLRNADRTVIVDTGNSPFMPSKLLDIYGMDFSQYSLEQSLAQQGIRPEDVTDVILTHLHFDHAGGAVVDGAPRFPNATYHVQQQHLAWARNPTQKDRASFDPTMFEPLVEHGVMSLVEGDGELLPGIHVRCMHGHTPFMQTVLAQTDRGQVFFPADLFPTAAHIPAPYGMGYDNYPLTTLQEKMDVYEELIGERWLVVFEHDALRAAGYVVQGAKGPELGDTVVV